MRWALLVFALSGCDIAFPSRAPVPDVPDAPIGPHNEDGDARANDDDPCPGVPDDGDHDGDTDGVGDICDPHPDDGRDRLILAEYFDVAPAFPVDSEQWSLDGGRLVMTGTDAHLAFSRPADAATIDVRMRVLAFAEGYKEVEVDLDPNAGPGGGCVFNSTSGGGPLVSARVLQAQDGDFVPATPDVQIGRAFTMRVTYDDAGVTCDLDGGRKTFGTPAEPAQVASFAISVGGMTVALDYVLVYDFDRRATAHTSRRFDGR